jgi:hypothetical protein
MSDRNFDNSTPAAPSGLNITWQQDGNGNLSAYTPVFGPSGTDHAPGLVPDPGSTSGATHYLREDGNWEVPSTGSGAFPAGANIIPIPPSNVGSPNNGFGGLSIIVKALGGFVQAFTNAFQVTFSIYGNSSFVGSTYDTKISSAVIRRAAKDSTAWIDSTPITWGGSPTPSFTPSGGNVNQYFTSDSISLAWDTAHDFYIIIYINPTTNINAWLPIINSASIQGVSTGGYLSGNQTATASASSFATLTSGMYGVTQLLTA